MAPDDLAFTLPVIDLHADRYLKWLPAAALAAAAPTPLRRRNSLPQQLLLLGFIQLVHSAASEALKDNIKRSRPGFPLDGRSFPSSHTSTAFAGAEMFRREMRTASWAGYVPATITALMRISKRRHWPSDVLAGAALGITATAFGYWVLKRLLNNAEDNRRYNTEIQYP